MEREDHVDTSGFPELIIHAIYVCEDCGAEYIWRRATGRLESLFDPRDNVPKEYTDATS